MDGLEKKPTESYADVGGLEDQIQEIKEITKGKGRGRSSGKGRGRGHSTGAATRLRALAIQFEAENSPEYRAARAEVRGSDDTPREPDAG